MCPDPSARGGRRVEHIGTRWLTHLSMLHHAHHGSRLPPMPTEREGHAVSLVGTEPARWMHAR